MQSGIMLAIWRYLHTDLDLTGAFGIYVDRSWKRQTDLVYMCLARRTDKKIWYIRDKPHHPAKKQIKIDHGIKNIITDLVESKGYVNMDKIFLSKKRVAVI